METKTAIWVLFRNMVMLLATVGLGIFLLTTPIMLQAPMLIMPVALALSICGLISFIISLSIGRGAESREKLAFELLVWRARRANRQALEQSSAR